MSMENVKKFYEMLKANEGLTQEVTKLKEELVNGDKKFLKDGYVINKKIIPLAQKYGLDFTEEEFASYTRGQTFALSEGELLNISGGVGVFGALGRVFFSIVNFLNPFGAREDLMDGAPPQQIMVDRQKIVTSNNLNKENNAKRLIELEKEVSGFENGNIRSMLSDQDYETFMDLIGLRYPRCFESLQERIGEDFHKISMEESNAKGKIMKQIGNRLLKELEEKKQLTDQNTKLNEKIKAIEDSEKQTNRLNKKNIKELSEVINKQIDKLRLLSKEAADRDTKIKQEQKKNETLQQKVENLNKTIDEQNEKLASLSEDESSKEAKIKELNKKIVKNEILNKELAQNRSIYGNKNYKAFSKKDYLGNQVNKLVQFLNKINYNLENVSASSIEELRADIIYVGRQMMGEKENRYLKGKYYSYTATDANLEQEDLEALYNLYQQVKNNN
ncbi:unknown [Clostridium sp. CAG:557]|nr:unknown [Clostridium sp. CAG:557]